MATIKTAIRDLKNLFMIHSLQKITLNERFVLSCCSAWRSKIRHSRCEIRSNSGQIISTQSTSIIIQIVADRVDGLIEIVDGPVNISLAHPCPFEVAKIVIGR